MKFGIITAAIVLAISTALRAEPQWIWKSGSPEPKKEVTLTKTFVVEGKVQKATLSVACERSSVVYLNGKEVGANSGWDRALEADVKQFVKAGENEIRVEAKGGDREAGMIAVLAVNWRPVVERLTSMSF